ncbi:MAG: type II secretion system protein [Planctomycetota bacterium]|nr:MAG: type II secretion system protein [Planctomycetota bacterium]
MKIYGHKTGFTIVEMIIVVAVIAILTTMVIGIASRIDSQSKERLMGETFELLDVALEEFAEYGYEYDLEAFNGDERDFYAGLKFPVDCNGFSQGDLEGVLRDVLDVSVSVSGGDHEDEYSGSEVMYFLLSRVPSCRATLDKIHRPDKGGIVKSLITNKDARGSDLQIEVDNRISPLLRVIDPWGRALRYDYYENETEGTLSWARRGGSKRSFPLITSAGPDGIFGNSDDITNKK